MSPPRTKKFELAGVALGIWISFPAIFSLTYGLAGLRGHSLLTGAALAACLIAMLLLLWRRVVPISADFFFVLLALSMSCTFAINPAQASTTEAGLLLLTLTSYIACRFVSDEALAGAWVALAAVCVVAVGCGTIATIIALAQNWGTRPKPMVLGSDATPAQLVQVLAFVLLASLTLVNLTIKRAVIVAAAAAVPVAVYSAAQVRFAFAALMGSVVLVAFFSRGMQRKLVMLIGCVIVLAVVVGASARYSKAQLLANYAVETAPGTITWERPPSCDLRINIKNSIAIRKALALDGLYLAARAGFFGTGLDSFMKLSCVKLTQIHNSVLQAFVEFGWLGGLFFLMLVVASIWPIARLAKEGAMPLFLLSSLVFFTIIAMAHGRLSRDLTLFAVLGVAAGFAESRLRQERSGEHNVGSR